LVGTEQRPVSVDITVELPEVSGSDTTKFVADSLIEHPNLLPLVLLLKYFLNSLGLMNPFHGGLSSYSISILVIAWLEKEHRPQTQNIYGLFIELLRFYSKDFNALSQGIWLQADRNL
jgi:non-canonical poly(A) RNA polymerase PAPD5/7